MCGEPSPFLPPSPPPCSDIDFCLVHPSLAREIAALEAERDSALSVLRHEKHQPFLCLQQDEKTCQRAVSLLSNKQQALARARQALQSLQTTEQRSEKDEKSIRKAEFEVKKQERLVKEREQFLAAARAALEGTVRRMEGDGGGGGGRR